MAKQSGENSRFTDLIDEPVDHLLSPIKGYQDEPLVSLTEAIKPVSAFLMKLKTMFMLLCIIVKIQQMI
jgi:hypothetical protein